MLEFGFWIDFKYLIKISKFGRKEFEFVLIFLLIKSIYILFSILFILYKKIPNI
jgi:hypothetical protein